MSEEEFPILEINPNEEIILSLEDQYQTLLAGEDAELILCRVLIHDESDYGIILPAKLLEGKEISFALPLQLCIFIPNKTYNFKVEIVLETQLLMPLFGPCRINLGDLAEEEEVQDEQPDEEKFQSSPEALNDEEDETLSAVLEAIAPNPIQPTTNKKSRVEDIAKQLDEEFIKNAIWNKQQAQKQTAPIPREVSEPLDPQTLAVKQKMKSILRNMILS